MKETVIKLVSEPLEVGGIKALQEANLKRNLPPGEWDQEGFVTAEYTLSFLEEMNRHSPAVIAKSGSEVVGYALVAVKAVRQAHPLLADLFDTIDKTEYKGELLANANYVVVGQLCVAKAFRGSGLAGSMYRFFKSTLQEDYEYCLTDVAQNNLRSLNAHKKVGFEVIDTLHFEGIMFHLVLWDWRGE